MDNEQFWKTILTLLSDKIKSSEKITPVGGDQIFTQDVKKAEIL